MKYFKMMKLGLWSAVLCQSLQVLLTLLIYYLYNNGNWPFWNETSHDETKHLIGWIPPLFLSPMSNAPCPKQWLQRKPSGTERELCDTKE